MEKLSKRVNAIRDKVEQTKYYSVLDAVNLLKEVSSVKFDETCRQGPLRHKSLICYLFVTVIGSNKQHADCSGPTVVDCASIFEYAGSRVSTDDAQPVAHRTAVLTSISSPLPRMVKARVSPTAVSSEVQRIDAAHVRVVAAERIRRAQGRALALTGR